MASRDLLEPGLPEARERVVEALKIHFAVGHLDLEEYEKRLAAAHDAGSHRELASLVEDLPAAPGAAAAAAATNPRPSQRGTIAALLGGSSRSGRWYPPCNLRALTVLGGIELDFRDAVFPEGGTIVNVACVLGGVEVTVPPDVTVQVEGTGILGGFDDSSRSDPGNTPRLVIRGFALLGGVEVRTRPRRLPGGRETKRRLPR